MDVPIGTDFQEAAKIAKSVAVKGIVVCFKFNEILCFVDDSTVLYWLYRDYENANIMGWSTIGPKCEMQYSPDLEIELYTRKLESAKNRKRAIELMQQSDAEAMAIVNDKINGVTLLVHPEKQAEYKEYVEANSHDPYSHAVVEYGEAWAKLMQVEISLGKTKIADIAEPCQKPLGYLGITGFQYGCAVQALAHFWVFGEELRQWHNQQYGAPSDAPGIVNPAILNIQIKEQ